MNPILQFFLDNSVPMLFGAVLLVHLYGWWYDNFAKKDIPDDWFEIYAYRTLQRKYRKRFPGYVGQPIKLSKDKSMVYSDGEGNYTRVFKE